MEQETSGFYVIDILPLCQPSKKPFHLEKRMNDRSKPHSTRLLRSDARRAAFLEARRSKLACRFSHVREVLSRHKENLYQDCTMKRTHINETLETADKKRALLIQKQVENCAQVVQRAKEIAHTQQIKYQEDLERKKAELTERLRNTAWRRQRLLQTPRSKLLDNDALRLELESLIDEAATTIHRWWRRQKMSRALKLFCKANISTQSVSTIPFSKLMRTIQNDRLIKITSALLFRAFRSTGQKNSLKNPAKIFLSAFIIYGHPSEIIPDMGPEEMVIPTMKFFF